MLSTLSGAGAPLLMALTGDEKRLGKVNWKKVRKTTGRVALFAIPGALSTYAAVKVAQAAKKAILLKKQKNIEKLRLERAERARKLTQAKLARVKAENELKAATAAGNTAAVLRAQQSAAAASRVVSQVQNSPAPSLPVEDSSVPYETEQDAENPMDENEEIQETGDEGAEESAEVMGYNRTNDDYFVGAPGDNPSKSTSQLKVVTTPPTSKKTLYIIGGAALAAFLFRKQLKKVLRG